ncbi:hypothetical protein VTG60DRAFT_6748 [Thermothelomyces hinnuleus]
MPSLRSRLHKTTRRWRAVLERRIDRESSTFQGSQASNQPRTRTTTDAGSSQLHQLSDFPAAPPLSFPSPPAANPAHVLLSSSHPTMGNHHQSGIDPAPQVDECHQGSIESPIG